MMNGLETLIHPTEGFAAGESCTDTSEKERPLCVRACACMCVCVEILLAMGRCYGLVIGRRDKGRIGVFFSWRNSCVGISSYTSISVLRYAMLCYAFPVHTLL